MSKDITPIVEGWDFQPDEITVRSIKGDDGREKIQLRVDLGLMQLEVDGRPDGKKILGAESWLDVHQQRQRQHDEANPDGLPYQLGTEDCTELMRECVQYYHRYISFWHMKRYELCARDTKRNIELFTFIRNHAQYDRDKLQFDQWRPYVTMMHARAVATPLVDMKQWSAALGAIDAGIRGIKKFLADYGQEEQADKIGELVFLRRWRKEIKAEGGVAEDDAESAGDAELDPVAELQAELDKAIEEERYEDAQQLSSELKRMKDPPPPGAMGGPQA